MTYLYKAFVAVDPNNSANVAKGATGSIYAASDTAYSTPLVPTGLDGNPMSTVVPTNAVGMAGPFYLDVPEAVWYGGGVGVPIDSFKGVLDQATAAAASAATASTSAGQSALAAQAAATSAAAAATAPTDASVDAGIIRAGVVKKTGIPLNVKDYGALGDGTHDDTAAINAALAAVPAGGRAVYIPAGRYRVTGSIQITQDGTTLYGDGPGYKVGGSSPSYATRIEATGSIATAVVLVQRTANDRPLAGITLRDFAIDGGLVGTAVDGILFRSDEGLVDHVNVWRCSGNGLRVMGYSSPSWETYDTFISHCIIGENGLDGGVLDTKSSDTHWTSNIFLNNRDNFVILGGASLQMTANHLYGATRRNVYFNGSGSRAKFANCKFEGSMQELLLIDTTNGGYSDIQFTGCGFSTLDQATVNNGWDYVRITGPSGIGAGRTQFIGNNFALKGGSSVKARYAIYLETSAAQNTVLVGNVFGPASHWGTAPMLNASNSSLGQYIRSNFGLGDAIAPVTKSASYTLTRDDADATIEFTGATGVTVTVPSVATAGWLKGQHLTITQYGAGQVTLAGAAGVTLRSPRSLTTRAAYSTVHLRMRGTDEWIVEGDLT